LLGSHKLRDLRRSKKMTLGDLASATGFSSSYLSQIERQLVSPSLSALQKIADALEVSMSTFFAEPVKDTVAAPRHAVIDADKRLKLIYPGSNVVNQLLTPGLSSAFEFFWTTVRPGEGSRDVPYSHRGQECGIILKGTLEFHLGEDKFTLQAGQSIYFDPSVPHLWRNVGDEDVEAVWVVSPAGAEFPG
jgi:transcriptional regulator with XRE-family HTH domain